MKPGRPSAIITIDGRDLSASEAGLVRLRVVLRNGAHHWAEIVVWPDSKFATVKPGASLAIALGTIDAEADVLAGEVTSVLRTGDAVVIEGLSATAALSQARRSQTYVSQSIADIVRDLASAVDVDEIEASVKLEAYSVDHRRSVWGHLLDLAGLTGAEVGVSPSGALRFVPIRSGTATRTFRHGAEVIEWQIAANGKPAEAPDVVPHGAGSEAGQKKWHWLLHDPVGTSGKPSRVIGAFHSRAAADALAKALGTRAERAAFRGWVKLVGESKVRPGEIVEVTDLPGGDSKALRVLEVAHAFDASGFLTSLGVEGAGGQGVSV
jgi:hypothetical protein